MTTITEHDEEMIHDVVTEGRLSDCCSAHVYLVRENADAELDGMCADCGEPCGVINEE